MNWVEIVAVVPGAGATDVEKLVTDILEEGIRNVRDIRWVQSTSRDGTASISIRFNEMNEREFDKRVADMRREVQAKQRELPADVDDPFIIEITSSSRFPSVSVALSAQADSELLRRQGEAVLNDLEKMEGVDSIFASGLREPELQVVFDSERLSQFGIDPVDIADSVRDYYLDLSAGRSRIEGEEWLVRFTGISSDPEYLATLPVRGAGGELRIGDIAEVRRAREKARVRVSYEGRPAISFGVTKQRDANVIDLVDRVSAYIEERNPTLRQFGMKLAITDDQTQTTREAISVMQTNALYGLVLVLLVTWAFVGLRIGLITSIGIPFILSGLFWILSGLGESVNSIVLLGVVLSLGMLVDDTVVVAESIYYRMQRGSDALMASIESLREVATPVTLAVLTTVSVFGPLMFIPGLLGDFMKIIPLVVVTALLISLVEAFWMMPAHVIAFRGSSTTAKSRSQIIRTRALHRLRIFYSRIVLKVLRRPLRVLALFVLMIVFTALGMLRLTDNFDFFAGDPQPLYYISIALPQGVSLDDTDLVVRDVEQRVRMFMQPGEVHSITGFSGLMYTQDARYSGENYGQVQVSLTPSSERVRSIHEIFDSVREEVEKIRTAGTVTLLAMEGGPPTGKDVSIKVRGDSLEDIRVGADRLLDIFYNTDGFTDIEDDTSTGQPEYTLRPNADAARRVGISPRRIARTSVLMVDGEIVARMQDGEEVEVRVLARPGKLNHIEELLNVELMTPDRQVIPMREVVETRRGRGPATIRHFRFRRTITVSANVDPDKWDVVRAYDHAISEWSKISAGFPGLNLDTTGQLDDINEGLQSIVYFGAFGIFLMYVVLASFFRSYFQPIMIFITVIMALMGVTMGFLVSGNSISLYSLYGVSALMGITVNSSIVLIWAANDRLKSGMSVIHSIVYAARRRVVPILITSLTTMAGLFSLAVGLGGESLLWGPVAGTIVWGMGFSTILTLLIIPLVYRLTMTRSKILAHRRINPDIFG